MISLALSAYEHKKRTKEKKKEFIRILNKVYERPDAAIKAFSQLGDVNSYDAISKALEALNELFEEDYLDGE